MNRKKHIPKFHIPKDYFSSFEDHLLTRLEEDNFPKSAGFRIPNGYFDRVEDIIVQKAIQEGERKTIRLIPKRYIGYAAAIAACFVIAISIFKFPGNELTINTVQLSIIDSYIDDGNLDIDLYELTHYLDDLDGIDLNLNSPLLSDTAIKEYLMDNLESDFWMDNGLD